MTFALEEIALAIRTICCWAMLRQLTDAWASFWTPAIKRGPCLAVDAAEINDARRNLRLVHARESLADAFHHQDGCVGFRSGHCLRFNHAYDAYSINSLRRRT
jgi:hypothetical protein